MAEVGRRRKAVHAAVDDMASLAVVGDRDGGGRGWVGGWGSDGLMGMAYRCEERGVSREHFFRGVSRRFFRRDSRGL